MHARSLSKLNRKTFDHGGEKICEAAVATIKNRKIRLLAPRARARGAGNYPRRCNREIKIGVSALWFMVEV